jgi:dipeptidyl aminopeptidase/acylaminoacyl peptidase
MKRLLLLVFSLFLATAAVAQKRAFTIEDLYRTKGIGELAVSPDGATVAFTLTTSDLSRGKRSNRIWIMDADGRNSRALTQGDKDSAPHFAPDGKSIAFVRDGNLFLLPLSGGGEAKQLTDISTGVSDPVWSHDGKWIAFASDVYPECGGDDACNKKISDRWSGGKLKAHTADNTLLYRHWTAWKDGTVTHTFVASAADGKARDVTPGTFDTPPFSLGGPSAYDFSPDGTELVITSNHDAEQASSTNADLWLVSLRDEKPVAKNITSANHSFDGSPKYSPDGRFIAYRTQLTPAYESALFHLALYDRASGQSRILSKSFDNWIDDFAWSADSSAIYFSGEVEGRNPLYRLDVASGAITKIFEHATIDSFDIAKNGKDAIYIHRSINEPSEIFRVDLSAKPAPVQLTHMNDDFVRDVDVRPAETMWVTGAGGARVQVFIVKPHNFDPSKKYPLILNVHGGPQQQWADSFRGDWQVYPGAGYVVAFANPHGSTGFGQDYTASISGDWGGKPFDDLMKVTDALEKLPYVDRTRMGAMGWSYGGYMMNWFEGHTDRFKAIASMMGLYDLRSFYGATEELWFPEWDLKGQPWNSDLYEKFSPSNFVKNFKTPCMVITGERDYRVPYTQGLQMYTALQKMKVPSRLIVFSDSGHWPSWYEMALYYTAHLEWFQKYLGGGGAPWSADAFLRNAVFDKATGKRVEEEKAPENTQGKPDVKPRG